MSNSVVRLIKWGLFALVFTPLLYQPTSLYPFLTLKVVVFQSLVEILLAGYLYLIIVEPKFRPSLTPLFVSFSVFIFLAFVAGWLGVDWRTSLWSFPERAIGTFGLLHFWAFFVMLVGLKKEINWRQLLLGSFVTSLIAAAPVFFSNDSRPGSVFGNPNFLSAYLLMNFFVGLFLLKIYWSAKKEKLVWFLTAGLFLQLISILITQTRGVILGLFASLFFLCLSRLWQRKTSWAIIGLVVVTITSGLFWVSREVVFWKAVPGISRFTGFALQDALPRLNAWEAGWRGFQERPWLGCGWDNFDKVVNKYYEPVSWRVRNSRGGEVFFSKPHNIFVEYAVDGGLFLAVVFLIFISTYFYEAKNSLLKAMFLAYLIPNLFSLDSFGTYLMLVIVLALVDSKYAQS